MAGLEGAASEIGPAVGAAVSVEGGSLGATVGPVGGAEGLGAVVPTPEIGGAGIAELGPNINPEAEGLAARLGATLGAPEAGIREAAGVSVLERASEPAAPAITGVENGTGPAAKPEAPDGDKPTGELKPPAETEAQAPTQEIPNVPGKVANDPEYVRILGEHYHELKQQGEKINRAKIAQITEQSLSEYYDKGAKTQIEKGLPEEVSKDPLYQQELGKAMQAAQEKGEPLDANKLSQEALSKYQQEKDLQAEEAGEPRAEQLSDTDKRLQEVEQKLSAFVENAGSKLESAQVTLSAKDLALLLKALSEAKEPNPKKKENKLMLLLKLLGLLGLTAVAEAGRQSGQETARQK